jgi:hypothetical protein
MFWSLARILAPRKALFGVLPSVTAPSRPRISLSVECLEDRLTPSTVELIGLLHPAPAQLVISAPQNVTAGHAFQVTIKAENSHGHVLAGANGFVDVTSIEGNHVAHALVLMHHGIGTLRVTEDIAGKVEFVAGTGNFKAECTTLVSPAAAAYFTVSIPNATLHTPISVTITAEDKFGNVVTGYNDPVTLSVSPGADVTLPASVVLVHGSATFNITVNAAIEFDLTASDGTIQGTSSLIMF